ncbi:ACBP4 [Symbiodinium natans]|uniref:ACBP4 protein n=1 Tax=Symbiodinium natans TaxID=878477 RepID=A0A812M8P4_9DINO|nr:ACBP4 [Symbiodinium natans]
MAQMAPNYDMNGVAATTFNMTGVAGPTFEPMNGMMPSTYDSMNGVSPATFETMNGMMPSTYDMNGMMPPTFDGMGGVGPAFDAMGVTAPGFDGMMPAQLNAQMNAQFNSQMNAQAQMQMNAQMNAQMSALQMSAQAQLQMQSQLQQQQQQQQLSQYSQQEMVAPATQSELKRDAKPWGYSKALSKAVSQAVSQPKAPPKAKAKTEAKQPGPVPKTQPKAAGAAKATPKAPPKAAPKSDGVIKDLVDATPTYTKQKAPPPPPLPQSETKSGGCPTLDVRSVARLRRALQCGYLTLMERSTLSEKLEELAVQPPIKQLATVKKFLSPSYEDFRWISSKAEWLQRCLNYTRTGGESHKSKLVSTAAREGLNKALACHGLQAFALDEGCWNTFEMLPPPLQENVVKAVHHSLFLSSTLNPSEHFVHICVNEEVIYNLVLNPPPKAESVPVQAAWDSMDDTLYHQLLQHMLFQHRNSEDRCLRQLAENGAPTPGQPNSLLYVHMATADERMKGSAEVLSLLHAASACGLARLCARFLAEGLGASERAGHELATPLHLAAGRGALESVKVLLYARADVLVTDKQGRTPLYYAATAAQEDAATPAQEAQHQLQLQVCQQLLNSVLRAAREGSEWGEEESSELEKFAETKHHWPLLNLLKLNQRLRRIGKRNPLVLADKVIQGISELQYETATLLLSFFEDPPDTAEPTECLLKVPDEAMPIEMQAILESDFIQQHDRLRRQANRMHRRFGLSKRCLDVWVSLPFDVAQFALTLFEVDQVAENVFRVPESEMEEEAAEEDEIQIMNVGDDPNRIVGTIRKWDTERGFGFIVQNQEATEEAAEEDYKDMAGGGGGGAWSC